MDGGGRDTAEIGVCDGNGAQKAMDVGVWDTAETALTVSRKVC